MDDRVVIAEGLQAGYNSRPVLRGLDMRLMSGESLLVVGANGSGKSTLLRALFGLLPIMSGQVRVLGAVGSEVHPETLIRKGVRFLGQGERSFPGLSIDRQRRLIPALYGIPSSALDPLTSGRSAWRRVASLSVGQRRAEAITALAAGDPTLMFLDEPCAGLDAAARAAVLERLQEFVARPGRSLILCEHEFSDILPIVTHALALKGGVASYFGPSSMLKDASKLDELLY